MLLVSVSPYALTKSDLGEEAQRPLEDRGCIRAPPYDEARRVGTRRGLVGLHRSTILPSMVGTSMAWVTPSRAR